MDSHWGTPNHRKRKRRRGPERPAIPAQLFFDARLKGDVGLLSEDIFAELFPSFFVQSANSEDPPNLYIAVAPHLNTSPFHPDLAPWTILAVKKVSDSNPQHQSSRSTLHLPTTSGSVQALLKSIQKLSPNKPLSSLKNGLDIQVLDVAPLVLESIVISIDSAAIFKLELAHQDFNKPFSKNTKQRSLSASGKYGQVNGDPTLQDIVAKWVEPIRKAIGAYKIVHSGDLLPMPLPAHPITHAPAPPVLVELCEPVSQGLVSPQTRIVLLDSSNSKRPKPMSSKSSIITNGIAEEDEDTANEQFYSASEDKNKLQHIESMGSLRSTADSEALSLSDEDDSDSMSDGNGDAIGLSIPSLPSYSSGVLSALSQATPRAGNGSGFASPGSVVSTFSTATIRGSGSGGRLFDTVGLFARVEDDALNPKPAPEEDEEARVFMDPASLAKIGCFSGDWVRIEAATDNFFGAVALFGANYHDKIETEWRVAKVYAPLGQSSQRPRYAIDRSGRHGSLALSFGKPSLKVHLSPLLLYNLGSPKNVRIASLAPPTTHRGPMRGPAIKPRFSHVSSPPVAREVHLHKLLTPLSTERNLETSLFLGIRKFFESRERVVKSGDMIGIPIDGDLGKAIYRPSPADEDFEQSELLSQSTQSYNAGKLTGNAQVVWFKITSVTALPPREDVDSDDEISWGGVAIVKPGTTKMTQAGSERGKLPESIHSSWPYYLDTKRVPARGEEIAGFEYQQGPTEAHISNLRRRLKELISAATSPQALHFDLPPAAILLVSTQRHIGKATLVRNASLDLGYHTFTIDANDIIAEGGGGGGDVKTAGLLQARAERGLTCGPEFTVMLIRHIEALTADRMAGALAEIVAKTRIFVATTTDIETVPESVRSLFTHEIEVNAPDEGERESILRRIVQDSGVPISADVDLSAVALKTAALVAGDLVDVVDRAMVARQERLEKLASTTNQENPSSLLQVNIRDIHIAGGVSSRCITKVDFDFAVDAARKNFADSIGAPKIPNVGWDDVGGLSNVKDAVMETIQLPLERPELFAKGMKKRSGILFYGPPGTGKTLLAKAIATEFSLNFFSVKGPELLNMYIGESEANVRRVFQRARDARPCVVFFDELDSVAPKRGNQGDSGGVMDRIVSQLLAELDGMSGGEDNAGGVFVIGATNRPDLLDQALLRPGRFDKMLYLGVSDTHDKQLTILEALTRKFTLSPSLSLPTIALNLPFTYTGADLYALCSDAMLKAITRRASSVDLKVRSLNSSRAAAKPALPPVSTAHFFDYLAAPEDTHVLVEEQDFMDAMGELVPSVSVKELEHYEKVRAVFETGQDSSSPLTKRLTRKPAISNLSNGSPKSHRENELVSRTASLIVGANGYSHEGNGNGNGKGKGKAEEFDRYDFGFGRAVDNDDDLYSP